MLFEIIIKKHLVSTHVFTPLGQGQTVVIDECYRAGTVRRL